MTAIADKPRMWIPGIDLSHWLFKVNTLRDPPIHNLVGAWMLNDGAGSIPVDVGPQRHSAPINKPSWWRGSEGLLLDGTGGTEPFTVPAASYGFNSPTDAGTIGECTVIASARMTAASQAIVAASSASGVNTGWLLFTSGSTLFWRIAKDPTGVGDLAWGPFTYPLDGVFVATAHAETGNTDMRLYFDGVLRASGTASQNFRANVTHGIDPFHLNGGGFPLVGMARSMVVLNTVLPHEQCVAISADPYAPFRAGFRDRIEVLWPGVIEYTLVGPGFIWRQGPPAARQFLEVYARSNLIGTTSARLWDETAGAAVAGSVINITNATFAASLSGPLSLVDGRTYRLQKGAKHGDLGAGEILGGAIVDLP